MAELACGTSPAPLLEGAMAMAEEACDMCPPPVWEGAKAMVEQARGMSPALMSEGAKVMAEQACDPTSEESLNPQEPQKAGPSTALKVKKLKKPRRRRYSQHGDSFAMYFPRVLKQVHSGLSLSGSTVCVLDSFVKDMFERIASEAGHLARQNHRSTITSRDIQTAVRLLLPGEIGKHAVYEATRAISGLRRPQ